MFQQLKHMKILLLGLKLFDHRLRKKHLLLKNLELNVALLPQIQEITDWSLGFLFLSATNTCSQFRILGLQLSETYARWVWALKV